ncbi:MAG: 1-deoxy-D-xylulose-5-phosphate synthase, partial [Pseudomonadota bacterium]
GFSSAVFHMLAHEGALDQGARIRPMVLPDIFIDQDSPAKMYDVAAMNAPHIVAQALAALGHDEEAAAVRA